MLNKDNHMRTHPAYYRRKRIVLPAAGLAILLALAMFVPLPYFVKSPGTAEPVKGRVFVPGGEEVEKGNFLFTTVSQLEKPNALLFGLKLLTEKYSEVVPFKEAIGSVSDLDAYDQLVKWMRVDSESNAVIAAYHYMKRPIEVEESGVIVRAFTEGSPSSGILHEGDILTAVDGMPVATAAQLADRLKGKKAGDRVKVTVQRGKKSVEEEVSLIELDAGNGGKKIGIGFMYAQVKKAKPPEAIDFKLDDIGGPSAGLMLSLDILSKLEKTDYTRGHQIAGTGTIDADGLVGQIGGIRHKLVAADREGAEYFLVPKDLSPTDSNQKDAEAFLQTYKTDMKLIPVGTLAEAAEFLSKLPLKD